LLAPCRERPTAVGNALRGVPRTAMKRDITHKSRGRYLTPEEVAKYRAIREQIEREKPEINARIRAELEKRKRLRPNGAA
jgi:hypothetical protein